MGNDDQKKREKSALEDQQQYITGDEVYLLDLIRPLWQQKVLIFAITALAVAAALILVSQMTPQYKIYTQLKPGTYRWDKHGTPIPYLQTFDLQNLLSSGVFDIYMDEAGMGKKAPRLKVASKQKSNQLTAHFLWPDRKEGKRILAGFIGFLNNPLRNEPSGKISAPQTQQPSRKQSNNMVKVSDEKAKEPGEIRELPVIWKKEGLKQILLQVEKLKREIETVHLDLKLSIKELEFLEEKINVVKEALAGYEKNRKMVESNTAKIISLRDKLLQKPDSDKMQLLLLANTIQQNIAFLNNIEQKIETARKESISCRTNREKMLQKQEKDKLKIAGIYDKIDRIALLEVVEPPQASIKPKSPKRKKIVAMAGALGFFLAIILVYLRHFWITNRGRLAEEK